MVQPLILASASPRRRELMGYTGLPFQVITADAAEIKEGKPEYLVTENAKRKARAVWEKHSGSLVLGADTVVYLNGRVLGKPRDRQDAFEMISLLSGNWHQVFTGVCLIDASGKEEIRFDESRVKFSPLTEREIAKYVETGEPMDKAGAYAVQGIAGLFVERIEGSYSNVIGLPLSLVRDMLKSARVDIF